MYSIYMCIYIYIYMYVYIYIYYAIYVCIYSENGGVDVIGYYGLIR